MSIKKNNNYEIVDGVFIKFIDDGLSLIEAFTIPDGVTKIGEGAFYKCNSLKEIIIPSGVIEIGDEAFCACYSLEKITMPDSVIRIGESAFRWCNSLERINLPAGLRIIEKYTFNFCLSLKEITVPSSVTTIESGAFYGSKSLKRITIVNKCNIIIDGNKATILYLDLNDLDVVPSILLSMNIKEVILRSPKFSLLKTKEKEKFKLLRDKKIKISYVKDDNIELQGEAKKDDIERIKRDILDIIKDCPDNIATFIRSKIQEIDAIYNAAISRFKPEYGKDDGATVFDYDGLKNDTCLSLNRIRMLLIDNKDIIVFIKKLDSYKSLLNNKYNEYSYENNIESSIKNIIYLSSFLDDNEDIKTITKYLNDALGEAKGILERKLKGEIQLEDESFIRQELDRKLKELLNSIHEKVKDIPKYKLTCLYNALKVDKYREEIIGDDIVGLVNDIRGIINKLQNSGYKNSLKSGLNIILNDNKDNIHDALNGEVTDELFDSIVCKLRRDLDTILQKLASYANLDEYEKNGFNIYRQIDISFELINGFRNLDDELSNYRNNDVLLEVINIIKKVNEKGLDKETENKVYEDIRSILDSIMRRLAVADISTKDKYIKFIADATSLFLKVNSNIDLYVKSSNLHSSVFKK